MTEDFLTDDEQLEHVKRVVTENWVWVVGGVVLGSALIFGYRYYDGYRNERAMRAASEFDAMTAALERKDNLKSRQVADQLILTYPASPYADQARLVLARLLIEEGKDADAVAPLGLVMRNSKDQELGRIARLRLARIQIDAGKPDDALTTLGEDAWGPFGSRAHEVRGDAFYAKKDTKSALHEYQAALESGNAGNVDSALLQLKMADLGFSPAASPIPPVPQH